MHLQFKFTFSRKIQVNIKNLKKYTKVIEKFQIGTCASRYCINATENFKKKIKKIKKLCRVSELALGKGTSLPSARLAALGQEYLDFFHFSD